MSVSVHIAVLAVAKDGGPTQAVTELASAAGHAIVARATVTDSVTAIRSQLARWIDDPNIDVIIVSGGAESTSASEAMKPLVGRTLPGFTDLFRFLAFQEIGASAMQSNAEAAQCNSTFVFVIPASTGAVRAAMEKLILPQLDDNTTPTNLVTQMPRIQEMDTDAVPKIVVKEKTVGGSGMTPKSPARTPAPGVPGVTRDRPRTGANILRKDSIDEPITKPIDVAKLEQQIALSESGGHTTKRVDLANLPKLPPGADDTASDTEEVLMRDPRKLARAQSEPIPPPPPAKRPASLSQGGTMKVPVVPAVSPRRPPTEPPPFQRKIQRTEPTAVVPPARPSAPKLHVEIPDPGARSRTTTKPSDPPPRAEQLAVAPRSRTVTKPSDPPPRSQGVAGESRPTKKPTQPPPAPRSQTPSGPVEAVTDAPRPTRKPTDPPPVPVSATGSAGVRRPTEPPPPPGSEASRSTRKPTEPPPPPVAADASRGTRKPTDPPPAPARAAEVPTGPVAAASTNGVSKSVTSDPAAAVRLPAPRKGNADDLAALIAPPLRSSSDELPQGEFRYPEKKGRSKLLWGLALLAAGGIGFFAVVKLFPQDSKSATTEASSAEPPVVAVAAVDAAMPAPDPVPAPVAAPPDAQPVAEPQPDPVEEPRPAPPTPTGRQSPTGTTARQNARPTGTGGAVTKPSQTGSATPSGTGSASEVPDPEPPIAPPISTSDCDEVACVLAKYDRPCCAKFKPAESELKPRTAGGIPAELDKAAVRSGMEQIKPRVVACGEASTDKGTVKIAVVVKPDGVVSDASVVLAPNPKLGECVATAIRKAQFAKSVNGGSFTYPFVF